MLVKSQCSRIYNLTVNLQDLHFSYMAQAHTFTCVGHTILMAIFHENFGSQLLP